MLAVCQHHGTDDEWRNAGNALYVLDLFYDLPIFAKVGRVLEHEYVSIDSQDLVLKFFQEPPGDAHDNRERGYAKHHTQNCEHRTDGDERSLFGPDVTNSELKRKCHFGLFSRL